MVQLPAPALVCNLVAAGLLASAGACDRLRLCGLVQCLVAPCFTLLSPAAKPGGDLATSALAVRCTGGVACRAVWCINFFFDAPHGKVWKNSKISPGLSTFGSCTHKPLQPPKAFWIRAAGSCRLWVILLLLSLIAGVLRALRSGSLVVDTVYRSIGVVARDVLLYSSGSQQHLVTSAYDC